MATAAERLVTIDAAIDSILVKGQSFTIGDMTFTRADLAQLWRMRKELQAEAGRSTRGGMRVRQIIPGEG
ncbi:MAG TPA: hypothetical protein VFK04_12935 [Gemmatimonadaceae bacterium]|nr:hypothetical protein [Gemmatimonadaceae bacterium]